MITRKQYQVARDKLITLLVAYPEVRLEMAEDDHGVVTWITEEQATRILERHPDAIWPVVRCPA